MITSQGYPAVPEILSDADDKSVAGKEHRRKMAVAINNINRGKFNATLDVVVTASATSTVITDPRISFYSFIGTMAFDANGKADEVAGIYFSNFNSGSVTMNHRSDASTRSLRLLIIG